MQLTVKTPLAMRKLGGIISDACLPGAVIYLHGDLGAGKTTFTRGFLRKLGYKGKVKSPTFNLFETYQLKRGQLLTSDNGKLNKKDVNKGCRLSGSDPLICHFDLYRLLDPEELIYIGISDYFNNENICLIEWPEKGEGQLAEPDLCCNFDFDIKDKGRIVNIEARSAKGEAIILGINL